MSDSAHKAFREGVGGGLGDSLKNSDIAYNPAVSEKQRRYMGAALRRRRMGQTLATDPKMALNSLRDFARKP